ncbi:MAG TPA: caspase family protein [Pyrinomonadaceae bacterium]|jgi:tetratricopeptide (TPR) repeat protein
MRFTASGKAFWALVLKGVLCALALHPAAAHSQTRRRLPAAGRMQQPPSPPRVPRHLEQAEPVSALPAEAKRWALIIGVDHYDDEGISGLNGASNDARSLRDALVEFAGFAGEQVILLSSEQPSSRRPTQRNILRFLTNLRGLVPRDGLLLVSFAGHGIERGGHAYLLPSDAELSNDIAMLEETSVSVERMKETIRATGVRQVILLLDACRNDPEAGRGGGDNLLTPAFSRSFEFDRRNQEIEAFVTLYATEVGQRAYEYGLKKQGYFTWALVEGLRGAAANEDGEVTLARLVNYVQEAVPKYVHRDLGVGKRQRPFIKVEGYKADELVLAVTPRPAPHASSAAAPRFTAHAAAAGAAEVGPGKKGGEPAASAAPSSAVPEGAQAHYSSGLDLWVKLDYSGAETEFRKALALAPEVASYHHSLGSILRTKEINKERQKSFDALTQGTAGLPTIPDDSWKKREEKRRRDEQVSDCIRRQGDMQMRQYEMQRQRARDSQRMGQRPPISVAPATIPPNPYSICVPPAGIYDRLYDPPVTAAVPKSVLFPDTDPLAPRASSLSALLDWGWSEVFTEFGAAARLEPNNASYHYDYGTALSEHSDRHVEAAAELKEAVRLSPSTALHHYALGAALGRLGKWGEAAAAYAEAQRLEPANELYKSKYKEALKLVK